ncbi:MAG: DUF5110 domain-containing protein, partial [Lewinella sp.]|nr:DUF5110 domain-containing protein [Lewinella sp.]
DFHKGKKKISVKVKPDRIPVFVRAGATLPTVKVVQSTAEMRKLDNLELSVFLAKEGTSTFYWDAGEGYGYEAEQYTERTYTIKRDSKKISLTQSIVGDYNASFRTAQIRLVGLTQPPTSFTVDGKRKTTGIFYGKRAVVITVPIDFSEITIG